MATRARTPLRLDRKDLKILEIIQREGRVSKTALAEAVGLSLTPCLQRLQRLEQQGVIQAYRGIVDAKRLGPFVWVYTEVTLARHQDGDFARFEKLVRGIAEVYECDAVGGGIDYVMKLIVRDIAHYQRIIDSVLASEEGISLYVTHIVTKQIKEGAALPLDVLLGPLPEDDLP